MTSTHALVAALYMALGVQGADTPKSSKDTDLVTVRGCLHGSTLTTTATTNSQSASAPRQFQLRSSRELAALLKKHTGHLEEVTGVLTAGRDEGAVRVKEKSGSKGRVYVGIGRDSTAIGNPAAASVIEVRSVTHVENRCS